MEMGRLSFGSLVVAASLAVVLAGLCVGCNGGSAGPVDPRQQRLLDTVAEFHRQARTDGDAALGRYRTGECASGYGATFAAAKGDWTHVLRPSVYGTSFLSPTDALTVFYNPWSDVALIALWQPAGGAPRITEAELVQGDCVRKRGQPRFGMARHWRRSEEAPALAVCESAYQTLEAFRQTFQKGSGTPPPAAEWRGRMGRLQDAKTRVGTLMGAMFMVSTTLDELAAYRRDPKLAPARQASEAALAALRGGRLAEVLASADQTDPTTRAELADVMAGKWAGVQPVAVLDSPQWTLVFLDSADQAGLFVGFLLQKASGRAVLKRIELMDIWAYYAHKRGK